MLGLYLKNIKDCRLYMISYSVSVILILNYFKVIKGRA